MSAALWQKRSRDKPLHDIQEVAGAGMLCTCSYSIHKCLDPDSFLDSFA